MAKRRKMIIIKLQGGLGNQMFQYAFASVFAKKHKEKVLIDLSVLERTEKLRGFTPRKFELHIFNNQYNWATVDDINLFFRLSYGNKIKKKLRFNYPRVYTEPSFGFNYVAALLILPVYIIGYFQNYKYFVGNENYIKSLFLFPIETLDEINLNVLKEIKNSNSVAVHIRRGDYVADKVTSDFHGICTKDYYMKAIETLSSKVPNCTLVFFSDDCDWVRKHFNDSSFRQIIVDINPGQDSWKDMLLMSSCRHNIIANSSFSWWGAWLNENPQKIVIAPKNWFAIKEANDQIELPEKWIRI